MSLRKLSVRPLNFGLAKLHPHLTVISITNISHRKCAKLGIDVFVRDSIWGANFALLDSEYNPNPGLLDEHFIQKKPVGTKVAPLTNDGKAASRITLYAHCAKSNSLWRDNAVVVFGVNIANKVGSFNISNDLKASNNVYFYEMTAGEDTLYTKLVRVNGATLSLSADLSLPAIEPQIVEFSNSYLPIP